MRESKNKISEKSDSKVLKNSRKLGRFKDVHKKRNASVSKKITDDEGVAVDMDTDSVDTQTASRTCDSPVKSEYSEEGNGTDLSGSSSLTGGNGSQSSGSRSNQSSSTANKKPGIPGITFQPGTRLEAKDLGNGIWYAVKVVEVDWEEEEILIHFEKWSQRYDEWVPMDSSRLRPVMEPPGGTVKKATKIFKVGDKVMATWSDSRKYPATVNTVLDNDRYEVLFFDGFSKNIKGGRMTPLKDEELAKIQKLQPGIGPSNDVAKLPPLQTESTSQIVSSSMAATLGTKQERRERKRKLNVAELFHFKKRPRIENPSTPPLLERAKESWIKKTQRGGKFSSRGRKKGSWPLETSVSDIDSPVLDKDKLESQSPEMSEEKHSENIEENLTPLLETKRRENIAKGRARYRPGDDFEKNTKRPKNDLLGQRTDEEKFMSGKKVGRKFGRFREGGKRTHTLGHSRKEKGIDSNDTQRGRKKDGDGDTGKPARVTDDWEPVGEPAYIVDGTDGPRKSIIVADPRIPPGWTRHTIQRMSGHSAGKWDVFFVCPEGRKFRTRHELRSYYEERGEIFPTEQFDFSLGRRKNKMAMETSSAETPSTSSSNSSSIVKVGRQSCHGSAHLSMISPLPETTSDTPIRRVKTLLPRVRPPNTDGSSSSVPLAIPGNHLDSAVSSDCSVVLGGLKIQKENDAFRCPKEGCNKNFRKENLLQMHMKHYHPEYNRFVASTPNVADLAYARTVGERLEELHPRTPRPSVLDKINRFEAMRRARATPSESAPSSPSMPTSLPLSSPMSESPVASLSPLLSTSSRTSPVGPHRRIVEADAGDAVVPEASDIAMAQCSTPNADNGEVPQSSVRTLLPVIRSSCETPVPTSSSEGSETANVVSASFGQSEMNILTADDVKPVLDLKLEERESEVPSCSGGVSHTKSLRMVRRRPMTDFHMEPLLKKRKSDAEDSTPSSVLNGNVARQTRTESLRREELINCTCGYPEEDGLMIQCDLCMCWQHGLCNNIEHEDHVPEKYVCYICQNPPRERRSKHYIHDQDWLKEGHLPSLSFRSKNALETARKERMFKHSHELTGSLLQLQNVLHSLRVKVNIAEKKDHPKLYLWAHSWEKSGVNSQNQSSEVRGNNSDENKPSKEELQDSKEVTRPNDDIVENPIVQPGFQLPVTYDSQMYDAAEESLNLDEEVKNISHPSEPSDVLVDECDTKDKCFSQDTTVSTKEVGGTQIEEEKPLVERKGKTPEVTEEVVLDNNIDIATETEVATAEGEATQEGTVDEENMKKPNNSTEESCDQLKLNEVTTSSPSDDKILACEKLVKEDNEDEDGEINLSLSQSNLVDMSSSPDNPIVAMEPTDNKEPLKKIVPCAPQPEAPIDPAECRLTLLDHIDHLQQEVESQLNNIESAINELEKGDTSMTCEEGSDARTKETVQMLLRDLAALYDIAAFN